MSVWDSAVNDRFLELLAVVWQDGQASTAQTLRLPDFKDNLETRLLLLQRRLQEKQAPVQVERPARGRILLIVCGQPVIERGNEG